MSHKVHPKVFRIKETADWSSREFYRKAPSQSLEEDFKIREFLKKRLNDCGVERVEIERFLDKINIIIHTSRPAFIIGRAGKEIEVLKNTLANKVLKLNQEKTRRVLKIDIKEIRDPWARASLVAQWIASRLEKRLPYRRTLKQALERIMAHKEIQGAKVQVAGRLDGIEIARTEWLREGRFPRQTLRADIDYGEATAFCIFGAIGVKVWIFRGEKFD